MCRQCRALGVQNCGRSEHHHKDKRRAFLKRRAWPELRGDSSEKMSFQSRHLASLTAQLRTRAPGRFPSVWSRYSSLSVGASRSQIRWNSSGPSSSSLKISRQWIKCLVVSAFVTAGMAGWALGRNVPLGEFPELQVQYATIPEMEQVSTYYTHAACCGKAHVVHQSANLLSGERKTKLE